MTGRRLHAVGAAALLAGLAPTLSGPAIGAAPAVCNRACLRTGLDRYLDAVVHHRPRSARLAPGFRATENGADVAAGQGLWSSVTALGKVQRRYYDPVTGQAAYLGTIDEAAGPAIVAIRVGFAGRSIAESEAIITRKGERLFDPDGLARNAPTAGSDAASAPQSTGRAALIAVADSFLNAMQAHSGAGVAHTPDCIRVESGVGGKLATGAPPASCVAGFEHLTQIAAVAHRHYPLVDEQAGVVVGTLIFLRPAGAVMPNGQPWKRNLLMNVYTTDQGKLSGVFSVTHYLAPTDPESTGWPDPLPAG